MDTNKIRFSSSNVIITCIKQHNQLLDTSNFIFLGTHQAIGLDKSYKDIISGQKLNVQYLTRKFNPI